ncbi:MAG: SpoIID/LytB domain-containing protein [Bdellovibrionaceae bacterium]|nr:SpoIID/LytB domain-containing protein [Bdellovibrionales bacterium]MCB9084321.1 SpoIID/LytB domain-containing protein [Pseudobdellovibrionaceae bacterium]
MKEWILSILAIAIVAGGLGTGAQAEPVRVRLRRALQSVDIQAMDLKLSSLGSQRSVVPVAAVAPRLESIRIRFKPTKSGIPIWKIQYRDSKQTVESQTLPLEVHGEVMRLGLEPVPRHLKLFPREDGRIDVITELDVESYLSGVLPSEMPASWPLEALKAQVVASRSYMYSLMNEKQGEHFHLEASVFDQVYSMMNDVITNPHHRGTISQVIRETKDQVLVDAQGEIVRAYYHSDCGGQTEEPGRVWGTGAKMGTVKDPSCPLSPHGLWTFKIKRKELGERLGRYLSWPTDDPFMSLEVIDRSPSRRVGNLRVLFNRGEAILSAQDLRRVLGFSRIKSTNFQLHWGAEDLTIHGRGFGHGVGMCQWGARTLANRGLSYQQILKHYYMKARIQPLSEVGGWSAQDLKKKAKSGQQAITL